jgi:CRP/FNR family cyclic AMP-dependent transcriptional regulator
VAAIPTSTPPEFCAGLPVKSFAAGEVVLEEGHRAGVLYFLDQGRVEVVKGETRVATLGHAGAVFGDMSVLLDQPHSATVRCLIPSRFFVVTDPAAFLAAHPEASLAMARGMAQRLDTLTRYLVDLKAQFQDQKDHLGMVDEVLESLLHHQRKPPVRQDR